MFEPTTAQRTQFDEALETRGWKQPHGFMYRCAINGGTAEIRVHESDMWGMKLTVEFAGQEERMDFGSDEPGAAVAAAAIDAVSTLAS